MKTAPADPVLTAADLSALRVLQPSRGELRREQLRTRLHRVLRGTLRQLACVAAGLVVCIVIGAVGIGAVVLLRATVYKASPPTQQVYSQAKCAAIAQETLASAELSMRRGAYSNAQVTLNYPAPANCATYFPGWPYP